MSSDKNTYICFCDNMGSTCLALWVDLKRMSLGEDVVKRMSLG